MRNAESLKKFGNILLNKLVRPIPNLIYTEFIIL